MSLCEGRKIIYSKQKRYIKETCMLKLYEVGFKAVARPWSSLTP